MRNNTRPSRPGAKSAGRPKRAFGSRDGKPFDSERPRRSSDSERPKRTYGSRDDKPYDSERPKRAYSSDRPKRAFDSDRPKRAFDSDRPKRAFDSDRPKRAFDSDRPKRAYGPPREDKPFDRERKPYDSERPKRTFDSDRPKRAYSSDRPKRTFDSDRPKRAYGPPREDKPFDRERKPYDSERPKRTFDSDRPKRAYSSDRPKRAFDSDRPKKTFEVGNKSFDRDRPKSFGDDHAERPQRESRPRAEEYVPKPRRKKVVDEVGIRLNKFISNSGVCSRREADDYITAGLVSVNGQIITELGTKIQAQDDVRFNGERLRGEEKVYLLMNKPKDFVTTLSDPNADKTVMDLIAGNCSQRVYPVGRLDKSTTGVLLLTNDGEMAEKLTHPSNMHKKIYHVFLDKNLSGSDFQELLDGVTLEDGPMHADSLSYIDEDKTQVGLEIHSGRNRVVRRMFEHLGYKVKKLDRVFFAGLTKKNLRRGQWRFLTEQEVSMLKMGAFE
jgi:23S rRNA pseudouridine2605 synthase